METERTVVSPDRVAGITTWGNNCALSCTAIFLVNAFLAHKLSARAEANLAALFNQYYQTSLSIDGLKDFFAGVVTLPADQQVILGPPLRAFVYAMGVQPEEHDMLSNDAFKPLAEEFDFNVEFYANLEGGIGISGAIPGITTGDHELIMRPYYHASHYDLVMDDAIQATKINDSSFQESPHSFPIEVGEEEALKKRVQEIASMHANPELKQNLNRQIQRIFELARNLQAVDFDQATKVTMLASKLETLIDNYFDLGSDARQLAAGYFGHEILEAISSAGLGLTGREQTTFGKIVDDITQDLEELPQEEDSRSVSLRF